MVRRGGLHSPLAWGQSQFETKVFGSPTLLNGARRISSHYSTSEKRRRLYTAHVLPLEYSPSGCQRKRPLNSGCAALEARSLADVT